MSPASMSHTERIFQAILYEVLAILLMVSLTRFYPSNEPPPSVKILLVFAGISIIAMVWSYIYNLIFDQFFIGEKLARPLWLRIFHIVLFEMGLLCATLPILMWLLQIGVWQALVMDVGLTLLIMGYGVVFYWGYDWVRAKVNRKNMNKNSTSSKNEKLLNKNAKMGLLISVGVLVLIVIWVTIELSMNH